MAVFYNQATISYNGNITGSNIITGEIVEVLSLSKSAVTDTYTDGSSIVYTISIVNTGSEDISELAVTDDLGSYSFTPGGETPGTPVTLTPLTYDAGSAVLYVNGVQKPVQAGAAGGTLTISGITVPAEGSAVIIYTAKANSFAPLGENAVITNTASLTGARIPETVSDSAQVTHDSTPDLAISKSLTPSTVSGNGEVTYTFLIQNYGSSPVTASDPTEFRDVFDPVLSISEVTFNDTPLAQGTGYTYSIADGVFTSTPGTITVPAAEYSQDPDSGAWSVRPGTSTLIITGTLVSG